MNSPEKHLNYIDTAKGIGILLVVLGHNLQGVPELTSWIYTFHMPLFFIITGYLDAHKQAQGAAHKPIGSYIRSKAASLLWPYMTFSIVNLVWLLVFRLVMGVQPEAPFPVILLKMLTTYGYRAMWFLPTMFFASVIHHSAGKKAPAATMVLSILLGSAASLLLERMGEDLWLRYPIMYLGRIAIGVSFICIGKKVYGILGRMRGAGIPVLIAACFAVTLLFPYIPEVNMSFARMQSIPLYYLLGCAGSTGILLLTRNCSPPADKNPLLYLGKNSLIIMALHMDFPIEIAWMVLGKTGVGTRLPLPAASGLAVLLEMVILAASIAVIRRFLPFILKPPKRKAIV